MNPTTTFITFGSHSNYIDAGNRLLAQAKSLNLFTNNILYTGDTLKNDKLFWDKHSNFVNNNKRGYGYWLWKSYLIKKTMEQIYMKNYFLMVEIFIKRPSFQKKTKKNENSKISFFAKKTTFKNECFVIFRSLMTSYLILLL